MGVVLVTFDELEIEPLVVDGVTESGDHLGDADARDAMFTTDRVHHHDIAVTAVQIAQEAREVEVAPHLGGAILGPAAHAASEVYIARRPSSASISPGSMATNSLTSIPVVSEMP